MSKTGHHIASIGIAVPPYEFTQEQAKSFFIKYYSDSLSPKSMETIRKVFSHPSVRRRHFAFENADVLLNEDPDKCIQRFTHWAVRLSAEAVNKALAKISLTVQDVSALVVNTCTGYICPGISTYLIESLGLKKTTKVYDLVGSGCGGAIPNIELCRGLLNDSPQSIVVSVSVEICSCTFQSRDDNGLIISNAIFGDGAAAAVLWNRSDGLALISSRSLYVPQYRDDIRFVYKKGRLYNQLSLKVPKAAAKAAAQVVHQLLQSQGLKIDDIKYWALHAGGEKVINEVKQAMGLSEEHLKSTRDILANFGNISSPTVWFVLNDLQNSGLSLDSWLIMLTFGAGLSAHALLLKT